jgi:hypothetical protein
MFCWQIELSGTIFGFNWTAKLSPFFILWFILIFALWMPFLLVFGIYHGRPHFQIFPQPQPFRRHFPSGWGHKAHCLAQCLCGDLRDVHRSGASMRGVEPWEFWGVTKNMSFSVRHEIFSFFLLGFHVFSFVYGWGWVGRRVWQLRRFVCGVISVATYS